MQKQETAVAIQSMSMPDIAHAFYESGLFPDIKSAAQAIVKIQAGAELGFGPIYSMQKIYIVQGKIVIAAEAMGAKVKQSGRYDYRVHEYSDLKVTLIFTDKGKDVFTSSFSMEDARHAGLVKPASGWEKFPRAMLISKALSQGARIVCPEVIAGAYTYEDFGLETTEEGELKEPPKITVGKPTTSPAPETRTKMEEVIKKADAVLEDKPETPNQAYEKPESAVPKENAIKIDMDWLKTALIRLKYQTTIYSYIPSVPELKNIDTKSKDLNKVLAQMTPEQQELLVKKLIERAELSGVKLD